MQNVVIFGSGKAGIHLNNEIRKSKPDWTVKAFLDSNVDGSIGGISIYSPDDFFQETKQISM